jgi:hypothetical protein
MIDWHLMGLGASLALLHAALPSHWLPLAAIARAHSWTPQRLVLIVLLLGTAHLLSSALLGWLIGGLGILALEHIEPLTQLGAGGMMVALGAIYVGVGLVRRRSSCGCADHTPFAACSPPLERATIASLLVAMLLSPCLLLAPAYIEAVLLGWERVLLLTTIYGVVGLTALVVLTYLAFLGFGTLRIALLERHGMTFAGVVLILAGVSAPLLHEFGHQHHHPTTHQNQPVDEHEHEHGHEHDPVTTPSH